MILDKADHEDWKKGSNISNGPREEMDMVRVVEDIMTLLANAIGEFHDKRK